MSSPMPEMDEASWHVAMLVDANGNGPMALDEDYASIVCASCGEVWACDQASLAIDDDRTFAVVQKTILYLLEEDMRSAHATIAMEPLTLAYMGDLLLGVVLFAAKLVRDVTGLEPDINGTGGVAALKIGRVNKDTGEVDDEDIEAAPAAVRYGGRMMTAALNQDHVMLYTLVDAAMKESLQTIERDGDEGVDLLVELMTMIFEAVIGIAPEVRRIWAEKQRLSHEE